MHSRHFQGALELASGESTSFTQLALRSRIDFKYYPRFSEIEAVVIITMLISNYTVEVMNEPQYAHETLNERRTDECN